MKKFWPSIPTLLRHALQKPSFPVLSSTGWILVGLLSACSGVNRHANLETDTALLVRQWTLQTHGLFESGDRGNDRSEAVMAEGLLVFGSESAGLICLYPENQRTRWVLPIPGGVRNGIAVTNDTVFVGGGDGYLYAVKLETGQVLWRYNLRSNTVSKPTFSNGRLFVTTSDDTVYAFDAGTGEWLWHYKRRSGSTATIDSASQPLVLDNEVMVGLSDGFLIGLSTQDGNLRWEKRLHKGKKFIDVDAHPVVDGETLYIPSYDGALYALQRRNRETLWRKDSGGSRKVLIDGTKLYFPSSDGMVYALEKKSGQIKWKFEVDGGVPTEIVQMESYLVVGSSYRYLYVLEKETGKPLYRYDVGFGSGFYGRPLYHSTTRSLYFLSSAGNLYAFSLRSPNSKSFALGRSDPYKFFYR